MLKNISFWAITILLIGYNTLFAINDMIPNRPRIRRIPSPPRRFHVPRPGRAPELIELTRRMQAAALEEQERIRESAPVEVKK